jgi:hypothetical protein
MRQQLLEVQYELRLMERALSAAPPPTDEDKALFAERLVVLKHALSWLPGAIERAQKRENPPKSGFASSQVQPHMRL